MDLEGIMLSENKSDLVAKSWTGLSNFHFHRKVNTISLLCGILKEQQTSEYSQKAADPQMQRAGGYHWGGGRGNTGLGRGGTNS